MRKLKAGHFVMLVGAVLMIAALSLAIWNWHDSQRGGEAAETIREELEEVESEMVEGTDDYQTAAVPAVTAVTTKMTVPTQTTTTTGTPVLEGAETSPNGETRATTTTTRPEIEDAWDLYQRSTADDEEEEELWAQIDGNWYIGVVTIPLLDVELPVAGTYVYDQLRYTPCRYAGSYLTDNMIVAAHNYNSHFGRINQLSTGDLVDFTDLSGTVYHYAVLQTEILPSTAVEEMEQGDWDLTLFTCTLSGTSRVTVRCVRIEE
jgi:LPXTG-site transpeptidase (sortase) family protein